MAQEFREAELFTLAYNAATTLPAFRDFRIHTHAVSALIRDHERFKTLFALNTWLMERWDFRGYDTILTSSATTAKYVRRHNARHVCYCYFPTRAIWTSDRYFAGITPDLRHRVFAAVQGGLARRDRAAAQRVDRFIAISETSRAAIREFYDRDAEVLHPPVDTVALGAGRTSEKSGRYLLVSRLQPWKRVDIAVEAFTRLGLPLDVIGTGPDEPRLRAMAGPTVSFLGRVDDRALALAYGAARAVVNTPDHEYGLVPIEAAAAGTPSIALDRPGVRETVVGMGDAAGRLATAVLFEEQTAESLIDAVQRFEGMSFRAEDLVAFAAGFGVAQFRRRLREMVGG
jgi:glycosyltransferase involved in cell wall biosynthesis